VSHQFPVPVVVAVTVTGADVVDVVVDTTAVVAVVVVGLIVVVVAVAVVVDELQEAKTIEATMRRLTNPQRAPFSPVPPFLLKDFRIIHFFVSVLIAIIPPG
jgi:hypothetical protein